MEVRTHKLEFSTMKKQNSQNIKSGRASVNTQIGELNYYANSTVSYDFSFERLSQIFSEIVAMMPEIEVNDDYEIHMNTKAKIDLNFTNEADRDMVSVFFIAASPFFNDIALFLKSEPPVKQKNIQSAVQQKYYELKQRHDSNTEVLNYLIEGYTPREKKNDPDFMICAKALVLFYFENCSIFEKKVS